MLIEMLNILENFDLKGIGHNTSEYIRVVAEAMKQATADKDRHVEIQNLWTCHSKNYFQKTTQNLYLRR